MLTKMVMSIFTVSRSKGVQSPLMSAFSVDPRSFVRTLRLPGRKTRTHVAHVH